MPRFRAKKRLIALGIAGVAVAAFAALLPPRAGSLTSTTAAAEPVRGAVHVHSQRSDGTGTPEQIAAAAARAGLRFVILTDHGNGMREPEPPVYRDGVLCIDAFEVATTDGHVVVLGVWSRTPYPLGGEARDVVEDVARLGGMSIAAHPESAKPDLAWKAWDVPVDGIEWLNADSEWRDESVAALARALVTYPIRPPETLAWLLDRPTSVLRRWDVATRSRRVVALAAADAHANVGLANKLPSPSDQPRLSLPTYDASFRTFSVALPTVRLTGDAGADARAVVEEIRRGHVYSAIDALARPGRLEVTATGGGRTASPGDSLPASGPVTIRAVSNAPAGSRILMLADGREVASHDGPELIFEAPAAPGAYRVEVYLPGAPRDGTALPWLSSNPVYVGGPKEPIAAPARWSPSETLMQYTGGELSPKRWGIEKNEDSLGDFNSVQGSKTGERLLFRYALGGAPTDNPWVTLGMRSGPNLARFDRVIFNARADTPSRLWVGLCRYAAEPAEGKPIAASNFYWRRSIYLDSTERDFSVRFADMRPAGDAPPTPPLAEVHSIVFMVDQTHTPLGGRGRVWIDDIKYAR